MTFQKPKITKKEVSQKFNLGKLFGVDFAKDPDLKQEIGQAIIDKIIERTEEGKAIGGKKDLKSYSKEYVESDEFKDFGKSKNKVNMTLTGRMLDDIDIISESRNVIKVGFEDKTETEKAFNHNTADTIKTKRPFFGITKGELDEIRKEFRDDLKAIEPKKRKKDAPNRTTVTELLTELNALGDIFGES